MNDRKALIDVLEPSAADRNYAYDHSESAASLVQTSQAISLKRIADALQPIDITGTPETGSLAQINAAITGYVDALLRRENGVVATGAAFASICNIMERFPTQEYDRRRAEKS